MLILDSEQVTACLPMDEAIAAMKSAFAAISNGTANVPPRGHLDLVKRAGTVLTMPAHVQTDESEILSIKVATVFQNNHQRDLPTVLASMLALDPQTGKPLALMDGTSLTAIRTAAASAAASDILARPESRTLAVIGSGVLARTHIRAFAQIRELDKVLVYSRSREKCTALCDEVSSTVAFQLEVSDSADEAVSAADMVCTVTNASAPVLHDRALQPGTHLVAVGSHDPGAAEIPAESVARAKIYVDQLEPALRSGDLRQPLDRNLICRKDIAGEIGELINGEANGRESEDEITFFKSVGNAAQDSFATQTVMKNASQRGIGTSIRF